MKNTTIENISRRESSELGLTHLLFTDGSGEPRFGRVVPFPLDLHRLEYILELAGKAQGVLVPDACSTMPDGTLCLSIPLNSMTPNLRGYSLDDLLAPLRALHLSGLNHLSIDRNSWVQDRNGNAFLIFWGEGLFRTSCGSAPEVVSGGYPNALSDLYMLAGSPLFEDAAGTGSLDARIEGLRSASYRRRLNSAEKLGYQFPPLFPVELSPGLSDFTVLFGGNWKERDLAINGLVADASAGGWACRVLRRAAGEKGRPLPDVPAGTVTSSPGQLLQNAFAGRPGIEKLLVICDLAGDQQDTCLQLERLRRIMPPGLHIVVTTTDEGVFPKENRLVIPGEPLQASDIPLSRETEHLGNCCAGPSWYGPRCRAGVTGSAAPDLLNLSWRTLFREGALLNTVNCPAPGNVRERAESLLRLGRFREALEACPKDDLDLQGEILISLGEHEKATALLKNGDPLLLATALKGTGRIKQALKVLSVTGEPDHLPELAELWDLSGEPAKALKPLREHMDSGDDSTRVRILCSLRNLETRLGMYPEAIAHAEEAIRLSRTISSIPLLVKSLQARGRVLSVVGRWHEAIEDFSTAANLHEENALTVERPPHIDLFDLQLRMGSIAEADVTLQKLENLLSGGGAPMEQMLFMLKAYRCSLLGGGEKGIPFALRAEELASRYGMELYSGISTLYAGKLYIQAGRVRSGKHLLERARAKGHILGDRHLELLAGIELLLLGVSEGQLPPREDLSTDELAEERLILRIAYGENRDENYEELLEMQSLLTAIRLADTCGFPGSPETVKRILKARELVLNQLKGEARQDYLRSFRSQWDGSAGKSSSSKRTGEVLDSVARWVYEYGEGVAGLDRLPEVLGLEGVSLQEKKGWTKVPCEWPMYIKGEGAAELAPLLVTAAAAAACLPGSSVPVNRQPVSDTNIIGDSRAIRQVRYEVKRYASENVHVLITGETGTGKEVCARAIHALSGRSAKNFVPVDCGAIPENLMESELFGAAAGAYTGIGTSRPGLLQEADGGTLFLDEIGNLPLHMQVKLLRVLDTGTFRRLGENRERRVDLRVVAATNSELEERMRSGSFRSDLYYRLAVARVHISPLRERPEDIEPLILHLSGKTPTRGALRALMDRDWPGNVRELQNVITRAAILSPDGVIRSCHIETEERRGGSFGRKTLEDAIRDHIARTVESAGGNRSLAARILGCDPKTVRKYLRTDRSDQ